MPAKQKSKSIIFEESEFPVHRERFVTVDNEAQAIRMRRAFTGAKMVPAKRTYRCPRRHRRVSEDVYIVTLPPEFWDHRE